MKKVLIIEDDKGIAELEREQRCLGLIQFKGRYA